MTDSTTNIPVQTVELLRRARSGEDDAKNELVRRYAPRARGLAALRMGESLHDMVDCDDIVQDAMLTALERIDQFEPRSEGSFVCWLAAVVESKILTARRAASRQKRGGGRVRRRADLGVTTVAALAGATDAAATPAIGAGELDGRLERALLALGAPMREIVYRRLVLDMTHAEIALDLGLASADSSRALMSKALARLRQRLEPPDGCAGPDS